MNIRRTAGAAAIGLVIGGLAFTGPADAARCGGQPDGIVDPSGPQSGTWDSPGEVISYFNTVLDIRSSDFDAPPGQQVKLLCQGAPAPAD